MKKNKTWILMFLLICGAGVLGWTANAQKRLASETPIIKQVPRPAATAWEYKVVVVEGSATMSAPELDKLGRDGWELAAVQRDATTTFTKKDATYSAAYYYFKRAK
jgi:Flp pilus assembly protein CpaB